MSHALVRVRDNTRMKFNNEGLRQIGRLAWKYGWRPPISDVWVGADPDDCIEYHIEYAYDLYTETEAKQLAIALRRAIDLGSEHFGKPPFQQIKNIRLDELIELLEGGGEIRHH